MTEKYHSPTRTRELVWFADYADGSQLCEFEGEEKENSFYDIDKEKLLRLGLYGHGDCFSFDIFGGHFNIKSAVYTFGVKNNLNDKLYYFNNKIIYRDIIQYKSAYSDFNPFNKHEPVKGGVYQHSIGYKGKITVEDRNFAIKVLLHVPFNQPVHFEVRVVPDWDFKGLVCFMKNGKLFGYGEGSFVSGKATKSKWVVR